MHIAKKYNVPPNSKGVLFKDNKFVRVLEPGIYPFYFVGKDEYLIAILDDDKREVVMRNQELLSKDYVAFRLGFVVEYRITDFKEASRMAQFVFSISDVAYMMNQLDEKVTRETQIALKAKLASLESEKILENYLTLNADEQELRSINSNLAGVEVSRVRIQEVSFPKMIQEMFAKKLEAKIRAQTDLENARTVVASARALKNASSMLNDDPGLQFLMRLESIEKIASSGKHTFVIGDNFDVAKTTKTA